MRRSLYVIALLGLLSAFVPAGAASARTCDGQLAQRLRCWSGLIDAGPVEITLDQALPLDSKAKDLKAIERELATRDQLVVRVPAGAHTGEGGTVLLALAGGRLVAPDAKIDRLTDPEVQKWLDGLGACDRHDARNLCGLIAPTKGKQPELVGSELISQRKAANLSDHTFRIGPSTPPTSKAPSHKESTSKPGDGSSPGTGMDTTTQVLAVLCGLLVLLLTALLFLIRRSSRAVGTLSRRALAAPGVGAVPSAAAHPRTADEATTRLRVTPAPRYGRRVGNVPGPARSAVVRTELHPQGYVELDRVLYRAVWAEPGRPPPAPGGLVDVTDARERNSDVLYAFPPTTGRHAKGTRP
ncbi:hypothetical protein AB0D27_14490 [Streptomyces sp. NPDC048415]|uniref:hypothetical protein n=1 Tax=Streptomyces sp. NPDC048415 TaxID=3154822 RepID=UPI00343D73D7